jgi:hypothetical protein
MVNIFVVYSIKDLPDPINGVIYIMTQCIIHVKGHVDLQGNCLYLFGPATVLGDGPLHSLLTSNDLPANQSLIKSSAFLDVRGVTIIPAASTYIFDFNGHTSETILISQSTLGSVTIPCGSMGVITNAKSCTIMQSCIYTSDGVYFEGDTGTILIQDSVFIVACVAITFGASLRLKCNIRVFCCLFNSFPDSVGILLRSQGIPPYGLFVILNNFTGSGTFTSGFENTRQIGFYDNKNILLYRIFT